MLQPVATSNPEIFRKVIEKDEYAIGALLVLYSHQTIDEQLEKGTKYQNGTGFNGTDGNFGASLAEQYLSRGRLTDKQLAALKKILPKYHGQVKLIEPKENGPAPASTKPAQKNLASLHGDIVHLEFPFSYEMVANVKNLPNRRWNGAAKRWEVPLNELSFQMIERLGIPLCENLLKWKNRPVAKPESIDTIKGLRCNLMDFQKTGIEFVCSKNGRALIGDDMGLGKTAQALAWLQLKKNIALPALVICPASIKIHWARKALEWTELEPVLLSGKDLKHTIFPGGTRKDLFVVNYDIIHSSVVCPKCEGKKMIHGIKCKNCNGKGKVPELHPELKKLNLKTIVFDEIHYTKTRGTGRTLAAQELAKDAEFVLGLSGTPITNRPIEFFEPIQMINPKLFPSWWAYTKRYCARKHSGFGWDVSGASNTEELNKILTSSIMVRRLKSEVLTQLPPKVRQVIPIEIDKGKYSRIMEEIKDELERSEKQAEHLVIIEKAKQLVVKMKMKVSLEWIEDFIQNEKLVVFAEHREVIEEIHNHFKDSSVVVYGGTDSKARQLAVDQFQNDPNCRLFIGSKAAKEGLTLVAASSTAFMELWWTPGDHDQAEDRVNRIGQEAQSINAFYLLAADTIEEDIAQLLDTKRQILSSILDGKEVEDISLLTELMKKIRGEK